MMHFCAHGCCGQHGYMPTNVPQEALSPQTSPDILQPAEAEASCSTRWHVDMRLLYTLYCAATIMMNHCQPLSARRTGSCSPTCALTGQRPHSHAYPEGALTGSSNAHRASLKNKVLKLQQATNRIILWCDVKRPDKTLAPCP